MMNIFKTLLNVGFEIKFMFRSDVKKRDSCYIAGKYRNSAQRDGSINLKLTHNITIAFHNLKNYNPKFMVQELGKFNF